ncbi:metallophosphoesterase [Bailinhaonella thermotolerans]|uniref:metallophosphoesterase n=1 Tax=Bailinhaonella thermotolerans TaxID=1070861 RepID=UPI00192A62A6|nr:metallophosphoesterase [Bailinhaonella thermotolerans]
MIRTKHICAALAAAALSTFAAVPAGADPKPVTVDVVSDVQGDTRDFAVTLNELDALGRADHLAFNGDLVPNGSERDYEQLFRTVETSPHPPISYSIGNHEFYTSDPDPVEVARYKRYTGMPGPYHSRTVRGVPIIHIGTTDGTYASGHAVVLGEEQLTWLAAELAKYPADKPVLLFSHHPLPDTVSGTFAEPVEDQAPKVYRKDYKEADRLLGILGKHPNVVLFTSHTHWDLRRNDWMSRRTVPGGHPAGFAAVNTGAVQTSFGPDGKGGEKGLSAAENSALRVQVFPKKVRIESRDFYRREVIRAVEIPMGGDYKPVEVAKPAWPARPVPPRKPHALTGTIGNETFDGVKLQPAVDEGIPADLLGWTHQGPAGWKVETSEAMPDGMREWRGWSFVTPRFWTAADTQLREAFSRGDGVIAVADSDEHDDKDNPAKVAPFDSTLVSPAYRVTGGSTVHVGFASHYRQEDRQRARAYVRFSDGTERELLAYGPGTADDAGTRDQYVTREVQVPAGATSMEVRWRMHDARNNWYWAIDDVQVSAAKVVAPVTGMSAEPAADARDLPGKGWWLPQAKVTVTDSNGAPVSRALVEVRFFTKGDAHWPDGSYTTRHGWTDAQGVTTIMGQGPTKAEYAWVTVQKITHQTLGDSPATTAAKILPPPNS